MYKLTIILKRQSKMPVHLEDINNTAAAVNNNTKLVFVSFDLKDESTTVITIYYKCYL